jgi:hypothetical protein
LLECQPQVLSLALIKLFHVASNRPRPLTQSA